MSVSLREVFVARVRMSSANQTTGRREVDEMTEEITLAFPPETRAKIKEVRSKFRRQILRSSLHFYGLQVIRADAVAEVRNLVEQAGVELRSVDPSLSANLVLIPLSVDAAARGELYESVVSAIRGQVYKVLLERLEKLAQKKDVPERSRIALLDFLDRASQWNVVEDPDIEESLRRFRVQFEHGVVGPVYEDLKKVVASTENAAAYVEL